MKKKTKLELDLMFLKKCRLFNIIEISPVQVVQEIFAQLRILLFMAKPAFR